MHRGDVWPWQYAQMPSSGPGNQAAFFEIAATLIPLLFFGGLLAEKLRATDGSSARETTLFAYGIPVFGGFAVLAEFLALSAVVVGRASWFATAVVSLFVASGLLTVIALLWHPWHVRLSRAAPKKARSAEQLAVIMLLLGLVLSVGFIVRVVEHQGRFESIDEDLLQAEQAADRANQLLLSSGEARAHADDLELALGRINHELIEANLSNANPLIVESLEDQRKAVQRSHLAALRLVRRDLRGAHVELDQAPDLVVPEH